MNDILFWNKWSRTSRFTLYVSAFVSLLALVFFLLYFKVGYESLIEWSVRQDVDKVEIEVKKYQNNLIEYPVVVENYLIHNDYVSKGFGIRLLESKIYLGFIVFSFAILLTALSGIKKSTWFAASMTFLIAYLAFMDLESIGGGTLVIGDRAFSYALMMGLVVLLTPVILFNMVFENVSFILRFGVILVAILAFGAYLFSVSEINNTFLAITNQGVMIPVVLATLFIMMVAYDVVSFIGATVSFSKSASGLNNAYNVLIGGLLYIINLLLTFLEHRGVIDLGLLYFNPFVLLCVSSIVGFWGHKRRQTLFTKIIDLNPYGILLYFGLVIITFSTIAYSFLTVSETFIMYFEDVILITHLFFGGLFLIYLLFNFVDYLQQNKPIYKVMYQPVHMKYSFVRLGAVMAILALLVKEDIQHKRWFKSGMNSLKGDIEFAEGNLINARFFYKKANNVLVQGIKTNYYLSQLYMLDGQRKEANTHLKNLEIIKQSPFVYVLMAKNFKKDEYNPYKDLLVLREGIKKYPKSEHLNFAIASTFEAYQMYDSAQFYYAQCLELSERKAIIYSNLLGIYVKSEVFEEAQEHVNQFGNHSDLAFETNLLAFENASKIGTSIVFNKNYFDAKGMNELNGAYANNFLINSVAQDSSNFDVLNFLKKKDESGINWNLWSFIEGIYFANEHKVQEAKNSFDEVILGVPYNFQPYYANIAGIYMQEEGYKEAALAYWKRSSDIQQYKTLNSSILYFSFLKLPDLDQDEALALLDEMDRRDPVFNEITAKLRPVFTVNGIDDVIAMSDEQKYYTLVLNRTFQTEQSVISILNSIEWEELKNLAIVELIDVCVKNGDASLAEKVWLVKSGKVNREIYHRLNYRYLKLLDLMGDYQQLKKEVNEIELSPEEEKYRDYYIARANYETGNIELAKDKLTTLQKTLPASEEVYLLYIDILLGSEDYEAAYDEAVAASQLFPANILIKKRYCLLALHVHLLDYAEEALLELKEVMPRLAFNNFEKEFKLLYSTKIVD